jgi:hypothetical protein
MDGVARIFPLQPLRREGEVHHHDRIFFHNANEQQNPDNGDDAEINLIPAVAHGNMIGNEQSEEGTHPRRRQGRKNGHGMDVAFIQDAEDDINRQKRGKDEKSLAGNGIQKGLGSPGKTGLDGFRQFDFLFHGVDFLHGVSQGEAGREVKRQGYGGKLALMVHGDGSSGGLVMRDCS